MTSSSSNNDDGSRPTLPAPDPSSTFTTAHTYSVTLPPSVSLQSAFDRLLSPDAIEPVALLSDMAQSCTILARDHVDLASLDDDTRLTYTLPASTASTTATSLERVWFELRETASYAFGLYKTKLVIRGCQVIDPRNNTIIYESFASDPGVWVWKRRSLSSSNSDNGSSSVVQVNELLRVNATSRILKAIIPAPARRAHKQHMDTYHTLFRSSS